MQTVDPAITTTAVEPAPSRPPVAGPARRRLTAIALTALAPAAGCDAQDPWRTSARTTALRFERALREHHGPALCAALAPQTATTRWAWPSASPSCTR
ncbi:hypothetical protein ACZ90_20300 [Streptomyces albus subsp. albus]|nr:hypothetical protein ACZ90_20300 [Streptomyces albus subsp. albus]